MRKIYSLVLAIAMVLAMAVTSFAAENVDNQTENHTYDVFQIFTGTQAEDDTEGKLAVTDWGNGIKGAEFLQALKADGTFGAPNLFANAATALDVAEALAKANSDQARAFGLLAGKYLTDNRSAQGVTDGTVTLDPGYYLVVDTTNVSGKEDAKNVSLLQVTKKDDFTISKKYDVPTVEKKVKDINDTTDIAVTGKSDWQDSADHDINDVIDFQLTGTLPSNFADFNTYFYQFNDTISDGLTYNKDAKVYVKNGDVETEVTAQFDITGAIETIKCDNLKALRDVTVNKDSKIIVRYTATLNEGAVIGAEGNPNKVNLEFSNNPNAGGEGDKGKTPDDTVIVFTYKVTVNKVDPEMAPLAGAEFTLIKKLQDGSEVEIATTTIVDEDTTSFDFTGLDDGDYILRETRVPAGYNGIADIKFTVTAEHDILSDDPALNSLSGEAVTGEITLKDDLQTGTLSTDVINKSGSVLPETGGIGTTLFYVIGAILVIGAGILLIAKKRMSVSEN